MRVTSKRLEQVERHLGKPENRWVPWENKPSPEIGQQLEELKVIRDSHPDPNVREGSIMDMLGKEFGHELELIAAEYRGTHEWKWIHGRCFVRKRQLAAAVAYSEAARAVRQCTAMARAGTRCRAWAMWDDPRQLCVAHGGRHHRGPMPNVRP